MLEGDDMITAGCGCQYDAGGNVFVDHCVCVEKDPTPRERLASIRLRIRDAQDAAGWAEPAAAEFNETIAHSVVEYGRCLWDLCRLVGDLLPEEVSK